jgi:class 3 adenylate cyclase
MAELRARDRAGLPNAAFAYIDSQGRRRLPIHDEPHVRNALARFNQVRFEDDDARERARLRLLRAAKRFGIVPVGFIDGQLRTERRQATLGRLDPTTLPNGFVTFLMTDIEGSTAILRRLGDRYAGLLNAVRGILRRAVLQSNGLVVDAHADEFFGVFRIASNALDAAIALQREMGERAWPDDLQCRVRAGLHSGTPTVSDTGYIGLPVHTASRICWVGHGGQIIASRETRDALGRSLPPGVRFRPIGRHRLPGLAAARTLFQVHAEGLPSDFPPPRISASRGASRTPA